MKILGIFLLVLVVTLGACASTGSERVVDSTQSKADPPRRDRDLVRK